MLERAKLALLRLPTVTRILVLLLAVIGIGVGLTTVWLSDPRFMSLLVYDRSALLRGQVWRLFTGHLVTSAPLALVFGILGVVWFLAPVERNFGTSRTVRFVAAAAVASYLPPFFLGFIAGDHEILAPQVLAGPFAVLEAMTVAWALENPTATLRIFFILPVTGRQFTWVALGISGIALLFGSPMAIPSMSAWAFGMLFGGSPSLVRRLFLDRKLARLRAEEKRELGARLAKSRKDGPDLRVVYGGALDGTDKPKDKRLLH
jgi:membrane associated rhomboid family serine protease